MTPAGVKMSHESGVMGFIYILMLPDPGSLQCQLQRAGFLRALHVENGEELRDKNYISALPTMQGVH